MSPVPAPAPTFRYYSPALLDAWREGVVEFNAGKYWDAHEKWERGWKSLPEPERSWVQAWIQLAGVIHLKQKGRPEAARALSRRALVLLKQARAMKSVLPRLEIRGGLSFLQQNLDPSDIKHKRASRRRVLKAKLLLPDAL